MTKTALLAILFIGACSASDAPLISTDMIAEDTIPAPLTQNPGDPVRGEKIFVRRDSGHCVLCHKVSGLEAEFQGDIGPDLSTVGDRFSAGQLRLRVVDYQLLRPGALMPSYYRNHDLHQVEDAYLGATILSAQDIEDIVAYLGQRKVDTDDA